MIWSEQPRRWLQAQWYLPPHPLLQSLEHVFRAAVAVRRRAYRAGWKRVERLPVPVIVVGNLTVGGTGKTPLTLWLAAFLRARGWRPGIVSRGYGGKVGAMPQAVGPDSDPHEVGDEPVMLARRSGCPVWVGARRAVAARALLAKGCDIVLADDGLQHYALARDIEIAVIDGARGFGNGRCLPAGPLREPPERLQSVDLLVVNGTVAGPGYPMALEGGEAVNLGDETVRRPLATFRGQPVFALAGIGHPQRFFDHLEGFGLQVVGRPFPDHHPYRVGDLRFAGGSPLFMTEKDAVKCRAFAAPNHWYVPVAARLPESFGAALTALLEDFSNGKKLLEILVCPVCKGELLYRKEHAELVCRADRLAYPIRDDIPVMLEHEARRLSLEEYDALKPRSVKAE